MYFSNPLFAKWTGSGNHFGFLNQVSAGFANYGVLVESVGIVISAARGDDSPEAVEKEFMSRAEDLFRSETEKVFRTKLGFLDDQDVADDLWQTLDPLMRKSRTDWTVFWRRLTYVMKDFNDSEDYSAMLDYLEGKDEKRIGAGAFYQPIPKELREDWLSFLEDWRTALQSSGIGSSEAFDQMKMTNPKFVLREWMLVDAYTSAANDQEAETVNLYSLTQKPYDEGTEFETEKYFRRAPDEALTTGGTAFMS